MLDLSDATDEELVFLAERIRKEQDSRLPLDPEPWMWHGYGNGDVRHTVGPQNDGRPYPDGTLSKLAPRKGYRQDLAAYEHTVLAWWKMEQKHD